MSFGILPIDDIKSCGVSADESTDQNVADVPSGDEYVPNKACFDCMERGTGFCKGTIQEQSWCPIVAKTNTVPSGDLISREDAIKGIQDGYCACVSDCIDEINKLPNMGTDCTDFIDWIRNVVADEELWELNAVGYGEIICRKLVKIGALATTEKLPYYYIPSADRPSADVVHKPDYSYEADMVKRLKEATSADRPQVNSNSAEEQIAETCDRPKGEWIHDGQNFKGGLDWCHCSVCGQKTSANGLSMYNFCPNCGADMRSEFNE